MAKQTQFKDFDQDGLEFLANNGRPIPGSSLTNSPDNPYPWEQPAQYTELQPAIDALFLELSEPEAFHSIMDLVRNDVPVGDIAQVVLTDGFQKGLWNPDLMLLLMEPTMYMVMSLAEKADIQYTLDSADGFGETELSGDEKVKQLQGAVSTLDDVRKKAVQDVNPQSVPEDIKTIIEDKEISPSFPVTIEPALSGLT